MPKPFRPALLAPLGLALCLAAPASAVPVSFDANLLASCILTVGTSGTLGTNSDGTRIGSEETGGGAATLTIVAAGGRPTITVGAPSLTQKPAAYLGSPTVNIRYTSPGGANQAYTAGATSYSSSNILGDSLTLHARATDPDGLAAGTYRIQTQVTCQQ
ncbi:hypothetical protein [Sphingomonas humi]|uniref:Spore coat protein U domain-containing protein n=1 Tax=Sphingomonas humi TaxID=335630 RepID=A0ABP7RU31_9SPHN